MGKAFFLGLLLSAGIASLFRPWIGVLSAYLIVILTPQLVWWWHFEGIRPALWVLMPTFVGFVFAYLRRDYNLSALLNKRNMFVLALWAFYTLSYYAGPYVDVYNEFRVFDSSWAVSTFHKIFILYFIACICINDEKRLKALVYVLIGSGIYLIYWANDCYLSGQAYGRIGGPADMYGQGGYSDENNFAMLFVVVFPFLWYMASVTHSKLLRWAMWLAIPFCWHAIFLTGSRGGLVGIAVAMMLIIWRSRNKKLALFLVPAFIAAFFWQAGDVMRDRAGTISEYQTESSALGRLEAWETAVAMMADHPLTGVGIVSFGAAFPDYSEYQPREAHNTFFQISAESGVLAGLSYVLIVTLSLIALWINGKKLVRQNADGKFIDLYYVNESALVGLAGLVICSMFLSLQLFEIFYVLCVIVNAVLFVSSESHERNLTGELSDNANTQPAT